MLTYELLVFECTPAVPILEYEQQVPEDLEAFLYSQQAKYEANVIEVEIDINIIDQHLVTGDKININTYYN